jgi:hypothetical protein
VRSYPNRRAREQTDKRNLERLTNEWPTWSGREARPGTQLPGAPAFADHDGPDGNLWFGIDSPSEDSLNTVDLGLHIVVTSQPPAFVRPGGSFSMTVMVNYDSGLVDTGYDGTATVALMNAGAATLGGTLTVTAKDGVATFTGLTVNQPGAGYRLEAYTDPLTTTLTAPTTVDVAPTIVAEKVLYTGKGRHKRVVGFELDFSKVLDPARAMQVANYTMTQTLRHGRTPVTRAVGFKLTYNAAADAVAVTLTGKSTFTGGGKLVVNAQSPDGITDPLGDYLDGT